MKARVRSDLIKAGEFPPFYSDKLRDWCCCIDVLEAYECAQFEPDEEGLNLAIYVPGYGVVKAYSIDFDFEEISP